MQPAFLLARVAGMDVVELREFYGKPLGRMAARSLVADIGTMVAAKSGQVVMGLGFALPYLLQKRDADITRFAFMLARHGVIHWPEQPGSRTALVDEDQLPLLESVVDVALLVHSLEFAEAPQDMLNEVWRVLAPQGRLVLVVPNRRGLWAASESTPFGHGQPFSRGQIATLLKEAKFSVVSWQGALYAPPVAGKALIASASVINAVGKRVLPRFSGVTIVVAQKQVYAFSTGRKARKLVPRFRPALLPAPQPLRRDGE
jgi:SAM-dependent methyltransferase